jgi:hypothetical protein
MPNNNQIITILLLLFFSFIIYNLAKPSQNNNMVPKRCEAFENNNMVPKRCEAFENNNIQTNQPIQTTKPIQSNQQENNKNPEKLKKILYDTTDNNNDLNNFSPSDNTNNYGSDLDMAFTKPDVQQITPDLVNNNKNNVKQYNAKDYLPKEINDKWFDTDFSQAKYNIDDDKLINTERYIIGVNTVGQSLKNASYDIRGTVPNPKFSVSPWNNSTYETDYNIKPLC